MRAVMLRPNCHRRGCHRASPGLGLLLTWRRTPRFEGSDFCSESCLELHLEAELSERWCNLHRKILPVLPRPKIGAILVQNGAITSADLERALALQRREGHGRLGDWLQRQGVLTEHQITMALSRQYGLPVINLRDGEPPGEAIRFLPASVARCFRSLPVGFDEVHDTLQLAMSPPLGFHIQEVFRRMTGKPLSIFIGDETRIRFLQDLWYGPGTDAPDDAVVFEDLEDLLSIARASAAFACENRALNLQMDLVDDKFWTRIDFPGNSLHRVCRLRPTATSQTVSSSACSSSSAAVRM